MALSETGPEIIDVLGQRHTADIFETVDKSYSVRLAGFAPGTYLVVMHPETGAEPITRRIVVQ